MPDRSAKASTAAGRAASKAAGKGRAAKPARAARKRAGARAGRTAQHKARPAGGQQRAAGAASGAGERDAGQAIRPEVLPPERRGPGQGVGGGQPPFAPTPEQRRHVELLSGFGLTQDQICQLVLNPYSGKPIDAKTLKAHFADELASGPPKLNAKVAQTLYQKATNDGPQSVAAAIFWLKTRAGWREKVDVALEVTSGVLVPPPRTSAQEWIAQVAEANAEAKEPGKEEAA